MNKTDIKNADATANCCLSTFVAVRQNGDNTHFDMEYLGCHHPSTLRTAIDAMPGEEELTAKNLLGRFQDGDPAAVQKNHKAFLGAVKDQDKVNLAGGSFLANKSISSI